MKSNHTLVSSNLTVGLLLIAVVFCLVAGPVPAAPPHPDLVETRNAELAAGKTTQRLPSTASLHALGIDAPSEADFSLADYVSKTSPGAPQAVDFRALAILVDFSDNVATAPATYFDSMIYNSNQGTVRHYFSEISYAQIDFVTVNLPSALGWQRAPQTYDYYVDGQYGLYGTYPQNSQGLVVDLVDAVDPVVDFSLYDNDLDGFVDILLVVHAGSGAELTGDSTDFWSHKWGIPARLRDGVYIQNFTVQPEYWYSAGDMTIGVYCHELCHGFGLPDLYDTDNSSNGIGKWGIMASGSWNGSLGDSPAHPSAWSRIQMGFASSINVTSNLANHAIAPVNEGGQIFRMWTSGAASSEYYLVENRQKTGYDSALPGEGMFIWHIDDAKAGNSQEWYPGQPASSHYLVAMEQADGAYQLEHKASYGGANDPYPGTGNVTSFNGTTLPSSNTYAGGPTLVAVENIAESGDTVIADLLVGIASDIDDTEDDLLPQEFSLSQNYPNPFNPSTTVTFDLARAADVSLDVFDVLGRKVTTLFHGRANSGTSTVAWSGADDTGERVSSGVYFYRLKVDEQTSTRKMLLIK
ncbi:MAG: M6 family metalloprotease domain-containing protein [candidate division Zixibacteria bacterium]|nr:M6 family metalloprotease domain-containing protein [candidate division Zixibacteria bacterium]